MKFFQTLIPLLEKYHVKICLENLYESVGQRIAEESARILQMR